MCRLFYQQSAMTLHYRVVERSALNSRERFAKVRKYLGCGWSDSQSKSCFTLHQLNMTNNCTSLRYNKRGLQYVDKTGWRQRSRHSALERILTRNRADFRRLTVSTQFSPQTSWPSFRMPERNTRKTAGLISEL